MHKVIRRIVPVIKNKYYITIIAFNVWIIFFDSNNLFENYRYRSAYQGLKTQKQFYIDETARVNIEKKELFSSPQSLEKFARERYYMKRDDEDIYIFESIKSEKQ